MTVMRNKSFVPAQLTPSFQHAIKTLGCLLLSMTVPGLNPAAEKLSVKVQLFPGARVKLLVAPQPLAAIEACGGTEMIVALLAVMGLLLVI